MARRIQSACAPPPMMSGVLDEVSLPELMQLLASIGRAVSIVITRSDGRPGELVLDKDQVVDCRLANLSGLDAFFALYCAAGRFEVFRLAEGPSRPGAIATNWRELVFEAARRSDEASHREREPNRENVVRLPASEGLDFLSGEDRAESPRPSDLQSRKRSFDAAFNDAMRAYLRRDYASARSLFQFCQSLQPHDERVLANLERLSAARKKP